MFRTSFSRPMLTPNAVLLHPHPPHDVTSTHCRGPAHQHIEAVPWDTSGRLTTCAPLGRVIGRTEQSHLSARPGEWEGALNDIQSVGYRRSSQCCAPSARSVRPAASVCADVVRAFPSVAFGVWFPGADCQHAGYTDGWFGASAGADAGLYPSPDGDDKPWLLDGDRVVLYTLDGIPFGARALKGDAATAVSDAARTCGFEPMDAILPPIVAEACFSPQRAAPTHMRRFGCARGGWLRVMRSHSLREASEHCA